MGFITCQKCGEAYPDYDVAHVCPPVPLKKMTPAEFRKRGQELVSKRRSDWLQTMTNGKDDLDEDGYPTDNALRKIALWPSDDEEGWFKFIESIWYFKEFGWHEEQVPGEYDKDKMVNKYYLSTAGWSGNESIIRAMEENRMMWFYVWEESRRGGHYIFERSLPD